MPAIHRWTLASLHRVRNERHMYISAHDDRLLLHLIPNYFNRTKSLFGKVSKHTCAVRSANEFRVENNAKILMIELAGVTLHDLKMCHVIFLSGNVFDESVPFSFNAFIY